MLISGMKMLMILSVMISIALGSTSHPMLMIAMISTQALFVCLILWVTLSNAWFSFILFLVFMGGLMVLFIYVSSLASNENISFETPWNAKTLVMPIISVLGFSAITYNTQMFSESSINSSVSLIFKIYSSNMMMATSLTMTYLLLALIIVVKIISLQEGPMRVLK
uniref:NADH-ubiquinone oxidoreductase chain 6 n=1 Tax=Ceratophysella communis TaxID=1519100 RepID=A0A6G6A4G5_9HEXA|nr:NADH dehydrogenase subunit 6 [Ceratophysella communis]QID03196.1 NADH dehydrogenase subunit 6 [Ceratophysella communis]